MNVVSSFFGLRLKLLCQCTTTARLEPSVSAISEHSLIVVQAEPEGYHFKATAAKAISLKFYRIVESNQHATRSRWVGHAMLHTCSACSKLGPSNQLHPWCQPASHIKAYQDDGIQLVAFGAIVQGFHMDDLDIQSLAAKYGKDGGQVLLRWSLQKGFVATLDIYAKDKLITRV